MVKLRLGVERGFTGDHQVSNRSGNKTIKQEKGLGGFFGVWVFFLNLL